MSSKHNAPLLTKERVHEIMDDYYKEHGEPPGGRRIVEINGGGSESSAWRHSKSWKKPGERSAPLPPTLESAVKELNAQVWRDAEKKIAEAQEEAAQLVEELEEQLEHVEEEKQLLETLLKDREAEHSEATEKLTKKVGEAELLVEEARLALHEEEKRSAKLEASVERLEAAIQPLTDLRVYADKMGTLQEEAKVLVDQLATAHAQLYAEQAAHGRSKEVIAQLEKRVLDGEKERQSLQKELGQRIADLIEKQNESLVELQRTVVQKAIERIDALVANFDKTAAIKEDVQAQLQSIATLAERINENQHTLAQLLERSRGGKARKQSD